LAVIKTTATDSKIVFFYLIPTSIVRDKFSEQGM
jgi:hypothetical protein